MGHLNLTEQYKGQNHELYLCLCFSATTVSVVQFGKQYSNGPYGGLTNRI